MEQVKLAAVKRNGKDVILGKKLRKEKNILGVVYGAKGSDAIFVKEEDFTHLIRGHKSLSGMIIELEFENKADNRIAVIQDVQQHPLKGSITHVDFHEIAMNQKIHAKVPVTIKGEAAGVKAGGVLEHHIWEVDIECLPANMPEEIKVDVSKLNIGDSLHVKDIAIDAHLKMLTDLDELLLAIIPPRTESDEASDEEAPSEPEVIGRGAGREGDEE